MNTPKTEPAGDVTSTGSAAALSQRAADLLHRAVHEPSYYSVKHQEYSELISLLHDMAETIERLQREPQNAEVSRARKDK